MKAAIQLGCIVLGLAVGLCNAWGKSGHPSGSKKSAKTPVNAALMLSGGESSRCLLGNSNDTYVVTVSSPSNSKVARFISGIGSGSCVVLPITLATGSELQITGVLQVTSSISGGLMQAPINPTSVSEDCFNVDGYSVGLAANSQSEFDPQDSANIINDQNFGLFWYNSDNNLKPGPYSYTVAGCSGANCPVSTTYYNSDSPIGDACTVLEPFPMVSQPLS